MDDRPKVLAFAVSARADSYNRRLVEIAARGVERAGAVVARLDLADLSLPIYDQERDEKDGFPEGALRLKEIMRQQDGFLFASPEFNASIAAPMKNAIDWASRPLPGEGWKACFAGKAAAIMSASPGSLGGLRGLVPLRAVLSSIQVLVIPEQLAVTHADRAFDENGALSDADQPGRAEDLGARLVRLLNALTT